MAVTDYLNMQVDGKPCFTCTNTKVTNGSVPLKCAEATKVGAEWLRKTVFNIDLFSRGIQGSPLFDSPITGVKTTLYVEGDIEYFVDVQGEGTGDMNRFACEWNPTGIRFGDRGKKKECVTLIGIQLEDCPYNYIGTELEKKLRENYEDMHNVVGTEHFNMIMATIIKAKRLSLSYNMVRGIYGSNQVVQVDGYTVRLGLMDGIIAKAYHAGNPDKLHKQANEWKITEDYLEAVAQGELCLFTRHGAEKIKWHVNGEQTPLPKDCPEGERTFESFDELQKAVATYFNNILINATYRLYDATFVGGVLRVTSRYISWHQDILLAVESCSLDRLQNCDWGKGVAHTELVPRMAWAEIARHTKYAKIDKYNAYQYFQDEAEDYEDETEQANFYEATSSGSSVMLEKYLVADPNLVRAYRRSAKLALMNKSYCGALFSNPNVVPTSVAAEPNILSLPELQGTGLFFFTTARNFIPLINLGHALNGPIENDVDKKCGTSWWKFKTLVGLMVKNFSAIRINLCGHPMEKLLSCHEPMCVKTGNGNLFRSEYGIPCYCPENRDFCAEFVTELSKNKQCEIIPDFEVEAEIDKAAGIYNLNFEWTGSVNSIGPVTPSFNYSITTLDGMEASYNTADFTLSFDSLEALEAEVINVQLTVMAQGCDAKDCYGSYSYTSGVLYDVTGECPSEAEFTYTIGDGSATYPDTQAIYVQVQTEGYAEFEGLDDLSIVETNYLGSGAFELIVADTDFAVGTHKLELTISNIDPNGDTCQVQAIQAITAGE